MKPEQALQLLANMAALAHADLKSHQLASQAVQVLRALINPPVKKEDKKAAKA